MHNLSAPASPPQRRSELRRYLGRFPGQLASVREARDWLRRRLDLACVPDATADDALIIAGELITNALLHSPTREHDGAFFVSLLTFRDCLRISVRTNGTASAAPHLRVVFPASDSEHGRGLSIVDALSATWGVDDTHRGPAVFFTLEWKSPRRPDDPRDRTRHRSRPRQRPAHHDTCGW